MHTYKVAFVQKSAPDRVVKAERWELRTVKKNIFYAFMNGSNVVFTAHNVLWIEEIKEGPDA